MAMRGSIMPTKGGCGMGQIRQIKKEISTSIHNRFDVEVVDAKTGEIKQRARGFNVICNRLWNTLFSNPTSTSFTHYFDYIHYGSGSGTPSSADTHLFAFVRSIAASDLVTSLNMSTGVYSARKKIQISETTDVGVSISEVGIADGSGQNYLCTHAMLQDMNGNPISILKTNTDIINIYATVYVHFNPVGYDGIKIVEPYHSSRNRYDLGILPTLAGVGVASPGMIMFCRDNSPSSIASGTLFESGTTCVKDVQSKRITYTMQRVPVGNGNEGGLRFFYLGCGVPSYSGQVANVMMWVGDSWFTGSNVIGEAVGTGDGETKDFELDFPYVSNTKIYVDGIEDTNVTIDEKVPKGGGNVAGEFMLLDQESTANNHIPLGNRYSTSYFYNPLYNIGLAKLGLNSVGEVYASNDFQNWIKVAETTVGYPSSAIIPEMYAHYKYWHVVGSTLASSSYSNYYAFLNVPSTKHVHFDNAPANGAVITADYYTDCVAKDENHVFDLTLTISIDEYSESQ